MNTSRIRDLAKQQGKSVTYICKLINRPKYYLNDVVETDIKSVSKEEKTEEKKEAAPALLKEKEMLAMPADGMIKPLSEAADEAFATLSFTCPLLV